MGRLVQHIGFNGDTTPFRLNGSGVFALILPMLLMAENDIIDTKSRK